MKFGLLIDFDLNSCLPRREEKIIEEKRDFDLLKAVASTNAKPEVVFSILINGYDVIFPQWVLRFGQNSVA